MYRYATPGKCRRLIAVVFVLSALLTYALFWHGEARAASGVNQQLNFQGRLYTASGATVPDGYYNIQFKIYQDGTGTAVNNPGGTLKWTEEWLNSAGHSIEVRNGFISVQLGSITPLSSIDWNQDTLWLSMNVGNTNAACTPFSACGGDGEMIPMKRLSSTPYALNAGMLGGKTASGFIQNSTTPQTANIALQSAASGNVGITVQGATAQSADLLQFQDSNGLVNGSLNSTGNQLTLGRIATSGTVTQGKLVLSDGTTDGFGLTIQSGALTANRTIVIPDSTAATDTVCLQTAANCGEAGANKTLSNLTAPTAINQSLTPGSSYSNTLDLGSSSYTWRSGYFGGAVYTPAIRPLTDSTTGIQIQNNLGTSTVMDIDTTNNRVGIGTTAPGTALQVATSDSLSSQLQTKIVQNGTGDAGIQLSTPSQSFYVGMDQSDGNTFKINSSIANNSTGQVGYSPVGGTADIGTNSAITFMKGVATTSGTITVVNVYVAGVGAAPNNKGTAALYTDSGNSPTSLLANSNEMVLTPNAWNTFTLTSPLAVTQGTTYWIGYKSNSTNLFDNAPVYDTAATQEGGYINGRSYTTAWVGNEGGLSGRAFAKYSMFANIASSQASDQFANSVFKLTNTGQLTLQNVTDSTTAFRIQQAAGANVFTVDTTTAKVAIGSSLAETNAYDLSFGGSSNRTIGVNQQTLASTAGSNLTVIAGAGNAAAGGALILQGGAGNGTNKAGGAVNITGGTPTGTGAVGAVNIQTTANGNVALGNAGNAANTVTLTAGATNGINLLSDKIMVGNATTATTIQKTSQTTAATQGATLTIQGATSGTTGTGGTLALQGGNSASGTLGGNVTIAGGTGTTSNGLVVLGTSAFNTATADASCYPGGADSSTTTNCTIAQASINNYASVIVGFTQDGQTAVMPGPTITTAGRVVYVTASGTTKDFTLSVNGGGQGNQIAMRKNTTATMIWNGSAWTAAGASSSTTMQAAYDNTLQSAGGAELVVSKTSATNGLTIRDSSLNPVNGTLLSVQTQSAAGLLQVNSNVTEYASNAGAETAGGTATTFPANTWSLLSGSTVTRYNTAGAYIATGQGSVSVVTPATANSGVKNQLASALTANTTYNVSFTTRLLTGTFTDMNVYYSVDGTATSVACTAAATAITSIWTKVNCTFTTPASGIVAGNAILIRQTTASARTFYVDNLSVTIAADYNFATDGSVNDSGNFATNWSSAGTGTVSVTRNTSDGYDASDSANANITAGAANAGLRNRLSSNPLASTLYRITIYAKSSNVFTDFKVRYSPNAGTNYVDCVDYNTQTISTADWTKVTCYIQTAATAVTTPYVYFVESSSSVRSFGVDGFNMSISTVTTPNVQVGGGVNGGPTTLFTLDKGASAPIASDNDALLGSMYYDTTLGKLQCYEADGWGACGSSPDNIITISPEYTNAVLHGTGIGTMTSDLCSDTLNVNDGSSGQPTICGTNETYNFYKWTSPQATAQTYGIYVTYQLPSTFKSFTSGETSLMGRTDSANSTVSYQIYRNSPTGLVSCGSSITVSSGVQTAWQIGSATGAADPSTCGFSGGESIIFRINTTASQNANAYVGNLNFTFSNR